MKYHIAELMLFNTCNFNCGYCGFAVTGTVKDIADLAPFRDKAYIDRVFDFFESNSTDDQKWILHLSGGEPTMMPNADYFSRRFIAAGHKLGYNTNLSLPIDTNGWMDANPPEGVDALIVSLHQEALDQLPVISQRVKRLRDAGYQIAVRMVAHPKFIPHFEELEENFKELDVSFGINPMYSPNYPAAYDAEQRAHLLKHMKVHYEAVRMEGGLDTTGQTCNAGSKMICVALGNSGRGDVYPCANTFGPENRLGNIFDDDVKLFNEPTECLRSDKCCSCSLHFIHGTINGVDDTIAHKKMLAGYVPSIESTVADWLKTNNIKTVHHNNLPQGTTFGENETIYRAPKIPATEQDTADKGSTGWNRSVSIPPLEEWIPEKNKLKNVQIAENNINLATDRLEKDIFLSSPKFNIGPGRTSIEYRVTVKQGAVNIELIGPDDNVVQTNHHQLSGNGRLEVSWRSLKLRLFHIRVSAATPYKGFSNVSLRTPVAETKLFVSDFTDAITEKVSKSLSRI